MQSHPVEVVCNRELHEYARELRDAGKHDLLYDVAAKVYSHSHEQIGARADDLEQPSEAMNDDALYDNIVHNCMAGARHGVRTHQRYAGDKHDVDYNYDDEDEPEHVAHKDHYGGYVSEPTAYARSKSNRRRRSGVETEHVSDAREMARKVITAQKMYDMPESREARDARRKGISWHMETDDDAVRVTRSRVGGTTKCYKYDCPSDQDFVRLMRATEHERDQLLRKGHF